MPDPRPVQAESEWQPRAGDHNAFVAAWKYVQARLRSGGAGVGRNAWGTGIVTIKNSSGAHRDRFDVLGIGGPLITPTENLRQFKRQICFDGVTPAAAHMGRFAILLEPVKAGKITQWGIVAGVTVAKVNFSPAGSHQFCERTVGDAGSLLTLPGGSARLLWPLTGTGVEWAVIRLGDGGDAIRCCLAETHPGYNIVFEVYPGTWNPASDNWDYSTTKAKAKDLFYADPEITPGEGATGMFVPRPSDTHGTIYMAISGDCDSPGSCPMGS